MKNLIFIGGTMGVGKSAAANILKNHLPKCVYLDGDWCWNMSPFIVNEETKKMVVDNITHLLCGFIDCTVFENIVFTWVMHEQGIIDMLVKAIGEKKYNFYSISLISSTEELIRRLTKDVQNGIRTKDVVERSVLRLPLYEKIDSIKIDTNNLSSNDVADKIARKICVLQTDRLILREMNQFDFPSLCEMLKDDRVMYAYEHAFSDDESREWLNRQIYRYDKYGFGLWSVVLKETGKMIGQCGITVQDCDGREVLEVGYLFCKEYWHMGYATESAIACKKYAFEKLKVREVFSIIRDNNIASQNVARRNGMTVSGSFIKHYYGVDMPHIVYSVRKKEQEELDK